MTDLSDGVDAPHRVDVVRRLCGEVGRRAAVRRWCASCAGSTDDPALLVGLAPFDDAAVYQVSRRRRARVAPPTSSRRWSTIPADFGAIAAANACSDVFAMGGRVVLALNVAAFPEHFPVEAIAPIFERRGRRRSPRPAARSPAATPSATEEPIFGLAVQGLVHPDQGVPQGRRPARRRARAVASRSAPASSLAGGADDDKAAAIAGMRALNRAAAEALQALGDGGARGHRRHRLRPGRPRLGDGRALRRPRRASTRRAAALRRARSPPPSAGVRTGGDPRNREYLAGTSRRRARRPRSRRCASTRRPRAACSPRSTRRRSTGSRRWLASPSSAWSSRATPAVVAAHDCAPWAGATVRASAEQDCCAPPVTTSSSASTRSGAARGPAR